MNLAAVKQSCRRPFDVFGRRMRHWWYGFDATVSMTPAALTAAAPQRTSEAVNEAAERAKATQMIWGEGYLTPGGPDYLLALVKPLNVNSAMSLLDLSAGLGGPTRHIATSFDVYITGLERSVEFAAQGHALSVKAGLAKKVPISPYDPEHFELRPKAFDAILGQYLTVSVQNKERFFEQVCNALKPRGQFTFTDFVLTGAAAQDPRLKPWADGAAYPIWPWTDQQYTQHLNSSGFNCRVSEDQSATFKELVLGQWHQVIRSDGFKRLSRPAAAALLEEGSKYLTILKLIDDKLIAFYRFYATLKSVIN